MLEPVGGCKWVPYKRISLELARGAYLKILEQKGGGGGDGGVNHRLSLTSNEMNRFIVPWKLINRECCHMNLVL